MELDRTILKKLWNREKVLCPKCKVVFRTITNFNKMLKDNK